AHDDQRARRDPRAGRGAAQAPGEGAGRGRRREAGEPRRPGPPQLVARLGGRRRAREDPRDPPVGGGRGVGCVPRSPWLAGGPGRRPWGGGAWASGPAAAAGPPRGRTRSTAGPPGPAGRGGAGGGLRAEEPVARRWAGAAYVPRSPWPDRGPGRLRCRATRG